MGIHAVVPVEEALHIHGLADLQSLYSLVHIGVGAAQIGFHGEGICIAVQGDIEVKVAPSSPEPSQLYIKALPLPASSTVMPLKLTNWF